MVEPWQIGVLLNAIGSVSINFGSNLLKFGHEEAARNAAAEEKEREERQAKNVLQAEDSVSEMNSGRSTGSGGKEGEEDERDGAHDDDHEVMLEEGGGDGDEEEAKPKKTKTWYIGTFFFVGGSLINFASFAFAAQSLLAALGSIQFVSNVFFGRFLLKEEVTNRVIFATATIVAGNILAILFSSHESSEYTGKELYHLYDLDYQIFLGCMVLLLVCLQITYKKYKRAAKRKESLPFASFIYPGSYASVSAIVGTQSVLQAKCLSQLLRLTMAGDSQLTQPFLYVVLILWLLSTAFWLTRMNKALAKFDGLFIIPCLQVNWTLFAIITGGVYFEEFQTFSGAQFAGFFCGVALVVTGVVLLAPTEEAEPLSGDFIEEAEPTQQGTEMRTRAASEQRAAARRSYTGRASLADVRAAGRRFSNITLALPEQEAPEVKRKARMFSVTFMPVVLTESDMTSFVDTVTFGATEDALEERDREQAAASADSAEHRRMSSQPLATRRNQRTGSRESSRASAQRITSGTSTAISIPEDDEGADV